MSQSRWVSAHKAAIFFAAALTVDACAAQTPGAPEGRRAECVGRMQLILPGYVDVAAMQYQEFIEQFAGTILNPYPQNRFADGQLAGTSDFAYGGRMFITQPLAKSSWLNIERQIRIAKSRNNAATALDSKGNKIVLTDLSVGTLAGHGWQGREYMRLAVKAGVVALRWGVDFRAEDVDYVKRAHQNLIAGLQPRQTQEIPTGEGVCLPYLFIADDGKQLRSIGSTYRSKEHPDITIWLEDSSSGVVGPDQDAAKFTPEYKTDFFWRQMYQERKKLTWLWRRPHEVKLDGREGVASFVELTRADDTVDYGYLAVVRGDPEATQDTPDLMLYVIRDAKNAMAKGKEPIGMDEFLEMAQTIAASVKHRPVR